MRRIEPPRQPTPSPIGVPMPSSVSIDAWKIVAVAFEMLEADSVNESLATLAVPEPTSDPPAKSNEFAHPWPGAPKLPHGHVALVPSPAQDTVALPSSRTSCD